MKHSKISTAIILCLISFLLVTINGFSQVLQKKRTTAPVIQKQIITPQKTEQKKAVSMNPVDKRFVKQDTANAKLTDVIIYIGFRTAADPTTDPIRTHYKPQIFLFDKDNHTVASWADEDYTLSQLEVQNGFQRHPIGYRVISLHMKIDSKSNASYASFKKGTIAIRNITFSNGLVPFTGNQDYFNVDDLFVSLKFQNPSFNTPIGYPIVALELDIEPMSYNDQLNLSHPSAAFSFSCDSPMYGLFNRHPLY